MKVFVVKTEAGEEVGRVSPNSPTVVRYIEELSSVYGNVTVHEVEDPNWFDLNLLGGGF